MHIMKYRYAAIITLLCLNLGTAHAEDSHDHHAPATDNRSVLKLTPDERMMILEEMRLFLDGVQKMTYSLSKQDMQAAADAARNMGQKMAHELPPTLRAKLPQEFRQLGATVHGSFDQMAMDAETLQDVSYTLNQLSATLKNCASCHATYQIQGSAFTNNH
jgi:cytochrome c556